MNVKIIVQSKYDSDFTLNKIEYPEKQLVFMVFRKPRNLTLKPPDKIRKVYLNPPGE